MESPKRSKNRIQAFQHAFAGMSYALRNERNTRIHALATAATVAMAAWLGIDRYGWALLAFAIGLVWSAELANTAIEATVNKASPELDPLAQIAKDVSAASVVIAAITAVIIGLLVMGPPLWARLFGA